MNDRVVVFTAQGPRILHGVNRLDYIANLNAVINPELPKGVSPDNWVLVDGKIVVRQDEAAAVAIVTKRRYKNVTNNVVIIIINVLVSAIVFKLIR